MIKFVKVPALPESRLYRTGDIVKHRADGGLEFMGRNDNQVKVRSFRIEPAEVETALCTHSAISQAIVVARESGPGNFKLVAYVVYRQGQEPTVSEVRLHLRQMLPNYMVPSIFVTLSNGIVEIDFNYLRSLQPSKAPAWQRVNNSENIRARASESAEQVGTR